MKLTKRISVLILLTIALFSSSQAQPGTLVGTYYYPWHTGSSFHGGNPPGSTTLRYHLNPQQTPALGWYDQYDNSVISQHFKWAEYAGIDFFVCSYWGKNKREDNVIQNYMFDNPDRGDIKLCVFLETSITPKNVNATFESISAEVEYLCDNYFNRPGYFRIDGKPVVFIYVTRAFSDADLTMCLDAVRTTAALKGIGDVYIVCDEVWGTPNIPAKTPRVSQMDAVTNYDIYGNLGRGRFVTDAKLDNWQSNNTAWKSLTDNLGKDFVPAISPGYNDRAVRLESDHPACSRKLNDETHPFGSYFSGMIQRLQPDVGMVMVNSWNEWHEDTQIEPTIDASPTPVDDSATGDTYTQGLQYNGYGTLYLDILRQTFYQSDEIPFGASAKGDNPPNETAGKAFDGDTATKWLDFSPQGSWIQYRYLEGVTEYKNIYSITSANDDPARDPMDFNLLGSNDGVNFDTLDSRTGIAFTDRLQAKYFPVENPADYNIYRLEITAVADPALANSVQIAEIELLSCFSLADLNCDRTINDVDLSYLAAAWLTDNPRADIAQPADGIVNLLDFTILASQWLMPGAPTPNPAMFDVAPIAKSATEITMTAVQGQSTDGPIEYYFDETSGNTGATDSGWITSNTYTDTGLSADTTYSYSVKMRDASGNQTIASAPENTKTWAAATTTIIWNPAGNGIYPPAAGSWSDSNNWTTTLTGRPNGNFKCVFNVANTAQAVIDDVSYIYHLVHGDNGASDAGIIRIADGGNLTTGNVWTGIGYSRIAKLIVESGGVINCGNHLWVGQNAGGVGTLEINGGTVNVAGNFSLGWDGGTGYANINDGVLNLAYWAGADAVKSGSKMDISNGTVIIGGSNQTAVVNDHIAAGRITAFGSTGTVKTSYTNGKTTIWAEP